MHWPTAVRQPQPAGQGGHNGTQVYSFLKKTAYSAFTAFMQGILLYDRELTVSAVAEYQDAFIRFYRETNA